MSVDVTQRDLLICQLAWQHRWLNEDQLAAAVRQWKQDPQTSLFDAVRSAAKLPEDRLQQLRGQIDSQAADTCIDPLGSRLQALPPKVRRLLSSVAAQHDMPTDNRFDTLPTDAGNASSIVPVSPIHFPENERFEIVEMYAQGGLGLVYVARDRQIERSVAVKQIKPQWADDANSRLRFIQEARITGRLEHPGVVPIYAIGSDSTGRPFYAMRFIRGDSLLEVVQRFHRKYDSGRKRAADRMAHLRKLLHRFIDVCNTIEYSHSKGVLHRDIKPANIILGRFGETLVVDWGLAKVIGSTDDVSNTTRIALTDDDVLGSTPTRIGSAVGTPAYMSPEQAAGLPEELGPTADVYSLGATLYQLLTGNLPHGQEQDVGVLMQRLAHNGPRPLRKSAPWLPRSLEAICLKALAPLPRNRYRSARGLADDLQQWLADEPVTAYAESFSERGWRWVRNHRTLVVSLTVAEVILAAAFAVGMVGWSRLQEQRRQREAAELQNVQQRLVETESAVAGARQSAQTELRAGRFRAAHGLLETALAAADEHPALESVRQAIALQQSDADRLATFYELGEEAEEFAFFQRDAEASNALFEALATVGALDHGDWWNHLPDDALTPAQLDQLQQEVYRKLILLTAAYSKDIYRNLLQEKGVLAAREVLAVSPLVQRFRPAQATRWHASTARMRLGRGAALRASQLEEPQNAADALMLAAIWVIASQNPSLAAMLDPDDQAPLDAARRELRLVESLAPGDYWGHFLRAYVELRAAGNPSETPIAKSRPHYVAARQALGHCIALKPDYWLAYAERSGACRQEIESRRASEDEAMSQDWESERSLQEMMIRDVMQARELAPNRAELRWYVAFALQTADQIDAAVDETLEAIDLGARFDVETTPRMVDPERQRALPEAIRVAQRLIEKRPKEMRYRLLRASANVQLGNYALAEEDVDVALQSPDAPPRAWSVRGWVELNRGRPERAQADFQRTLASMPQHAASLIGMARALEGQGDLDTALAAFDRARRNATTDYQMAASEIGRSRCLLQLGRAGEAFDAVVAARRAKAACEVASVLSIAQALGNQQFTADVRQLTAAPSIADRFAKRPPRFETLPLLNGGFELGLARHWNSADEGGLAWHNADGCQSMAEAETSDPHNGQFTLHISHRSSRAPGRNGTTSQKIPMHPTIRYRLTCWARASGMSERGVSIMVGDQRDSPVVQLPGGSYGWTKLSGQFQPPAAQNSANDGLAEIAVRIVSSAPGDVWIDDIRIEQLDDAEIK